ncbi:putative bifunctional diguanylate cyclase/phosphodiesterase [Janthinobacterium agaricidamnosum]|uniref:Diguanylate cyclase domain protein n=1 Tax=Janthinobacterium agaricidamnosum NBRC 102515 = DSM 9628 TaxID=1349767 RepID=W0V8K3_9BURK|nr:GGDEF domain-containing protein [Janthinobacterium agaricidamnosum]CDG85154.1 diguanylate cyclase domain protein [Janthinobacterium agaricidamnosum NBRC 102515 = DSM 9628]
MGIYSRLFIPISLLILVVSAIRYDLLIKNETDNADTRYQSEARELGKYVAGTLLPLAASWNEDALQHTLAGVLPLNKDLAAIAWDSPAGHLEVHAEPVDAADYPSWFRRVSGLHDIDESFPIALNSGANAKLSLHYVPVLPLNRIWTVVVKQAAITLINVFLIYLILGMILAANRKMLKRLAQASDRFQHGDHSVRLEVGGTLEARAMATTFNNMAGNVENLVMSLQSSQKNLADQLAQTVAMQSALQQMSWQNYHDVLTGLPNRAALAARFEQELFMARERRRLLAVCLIDLDHFQHINDRHGAESGDDILKQVAMRLHAFGKQSHYAARLGGDEFVVLLSGMTNMAEVEHTIALLLEELSKPYQSDMQQLGMTASAGIAVYTGKEMSTETLLRHADHAVYQAKLTGRNKYHFFDANLDEEVRTHHNQRTEIRKALLAGEFRLYYQPKVNMRSGAVVGMEALLRWQHPQHGVLGPLSFLPMVEQTDLIIDIGEWVLRQALWQMQRWSAAGCHWVVSVNIAARHFQQPDFVSRLKTILAEFPGVRASMLELEILESSALHDIEQVRHIMTACQAFGITFALDDFGTGYSSMSYLKRLPANILKIDQSFVRNMLNDKEDLHLVSAVIGLAKSFRLAVIAEGVETTEHGAKLMQLGCDLAQGYGIARPMPADTVLSWANAFVPAPEWQTPLLSEI